MKKYFLLLGACIVLGSCLTDEDAATAVMMLGRSSQAPVFRECRAVSENEIEFEFSQPVKITSINFDPVLAIASIEDGSTVRVTLEEKTAPGILLTADLLAEDGNRNTINVLVPLRTRNNRMPELVINEMRTENTKPKAEFIEFKMKTAGNLGAMRVFILGNTNATKQTIYEFMPVEVKGNEHVVLHLRKVEEDCRDELGNNLSESGGTDSSPNARDFWLPGNSKLMHKAATAVYVLDQDNRVLDAVMISATADSWWKQNYFAEAAEFLYSQGAWKSADGKICRPSDAVNSASATNTRTICRDETVKDTNTEADWYITATSSATPGGPNSEKRN
ncbi:MAG: hypothetical protein LBQ93_00875 [Treponema sp.]|nr:hypothetical protein [Treponema sp.]